MPAFITGVNLKENDLKVIIQDPLNPTQIIDPFSLTYDLWQVNPDNTTYQQILPGNRSPSRWNVGWYYVNEQIHPLSPIGDYEIRWYLRRTMTSPQETIIQRFSVVGVERITSLNLTETQKFLIHRLRILLRDNNPDKYYRFQPPTPDAVLQGFTEHYGFIWTDDELLAHLDHALSDINTRPPFTNFILEEAPTMILSSLLTGAAMFALSSLSVMWAGESFSYSISSISLDINKAAEYSTQRDWFQQQYQDIVKEFKRGIFFTLGLKQAMYNVGLGSRLGPYSKQGVLSARNWTGGTRAQW